MKVMDTSIFPLTITTQGVMLDSVRSGLVSRLTLGNMWVDMFNVSIVKLRLVSLMNNDYMTTTPRLGQHDHVAS